MKFDYEKSSQATFRKLLRGGHVNPYVYKIFFRDDELTAWAPVKENGQQINHIFLGKETVKTLGLPGKEEHVFTNMTYHELGHALYTTSDMELMTSQCNLHKIPFDLFNLFEDCRMEHCVSTDLNYDFNWRECTRPESIGVGSHAPEMLLIAVKFHEGELTQEVYDAFVEAGVAQGLEEELLEAMAEKIMEFYYPRIIDAKNSMRLFPLMALWRDDFTTDEQREQEAQQEALQERLDELAEFIKGKLSEASGNDDPSLQELSDLVCTKDLAGNASALKELIKGAKEVQINPSEHQKGISTGGDYKEDFECNTYSLEDHSNAELLFHKDVVELNESVVRKLTPKFERFLRSNSIMKASKRPSKRLHSRNLILDKDNFYKRKLETGNAKKNIVVTVDTSGSMWQRMKDLKPIIAIINDAAGRGRVDGHIVLSADEGYQTFKMPVSREIIRGINGVYGGEGLDETFEKTIPLMKKADYVFCITDGNIGSAAVNKKRLRQQGISPIGMYCGPKPRNLFKWFDRVCWREDAEGLVDEIVRKIK